MNTFTDKQTLNDLQIFSRQADRSIFGLFNKTATAGGSALLEQLFQMPLSEIKQIDIRSQIIKRFKDVPVNFPIASEQLSTAEQFLSVKDFRNQLAQRQDGMGNKLGKLMGTDTEYQEIYKGVKSIIVILQQYRNFLDQLEAGSAYLNEVGAVSEMLAEQVFNEVWTVDACKKIPYEDLVEFDRLLRYQKRDAIRSILAGIYHLDVYLSVAKVARDLDFGFAEVAEAENCGLTCKGLYHPLIKGAVRNDLEINSQGNLIFLTGANMAGKSTFMKSVGIALLLAHLGFPIPVAKMKFRVLDGIFTTINLPDNLGMGYSHFYAEVLRVKTVAEKLHQGKDLLVIFDELFRGTNVKDAFEGTLMLLEGFAKKRNSLFIVSTHIVEVGMALRGQPHTIQYRCLPTDILNGKPAYTYRLMEGISTDRHGMVIIRNERIIETLNENAPKNI